MIPATAANRGRHYNYLAMSTLADPFTGNSLDTTKWAQTLGGSASMSYSSSGATVNLGSGSNGNKGTLTSLTKYDLTGSYAYLDVTTVARTGSFTDNLVSLFIDSNNNVMWKEQHGTLYALYTAAGAGTTATSFTYNSSTHAFWRIRESAGTTYWDTSNDGSTWTNRASVANPIAVTALKVQIYGWCWEAESSPGTFVFKTFNS